MILHLLFPEKFGEYAIKQFSDPSMHSEFVIVHHSSEPLSTDAYTGIRVVSEDKSEFTDILNSLDKYKAIVLHGLFYPWQERVLRAVPNGVKVAWVFWGGDIYSRKDIENNYLSTSSRWLKFKQHLKRVIKHRRVSERYEIPFELLKRVDYCLTDIPEDYAFVKEYLNTDIKELWYNYYSIEETIGNLVDSRCCGNNILIGNSSSLYCNHIDGLKTIRKMDLDPSVKVYVPLSYGESWLKKEIVGRGRQMFGQSLYPITGFLPRDEYNIMIQSCSVAVMPHYRPQAFGNILTALWLGTRVYMSNHSTLYSFFKRIGTVVFSIEDDLNKEYSLALQPLSDNEIEINRSVISSIYASNVMRQKNMIIIHTLES